MQSCCAHMILLTSSGSKLASYHQLWELLTLCISLALPCKQRCHVVAVGHCCCAAVKLLLDNAAVLLLGNSLTATQQQCPTATHSQAARNLTTLLAYREWSSTQRQLCMQSAKGEVEQQAVPT